MNLSEFLERIINDGIIKSQEISVEDDNDLHGLFELVSIENGHF